MSLVPELLGSARVELTCQYKLDASEGPLFASDAPGKGLQSIKQCPIQHGHLYTQATC